jgi:t-SNARE complex subunit (syntaxin)
MNVTTIQNDSLLVKLREMAQKIEITGNSRELTDLEQIMSEMLVDGNRTMTRAVQSIDNAISVGYFWRRTAYTMAVVVVILSCVVMQLLIG